MSTIQLQRLNDGRLMVTAPFGPQNLPPVKSSDLNATWAAASASAESAFYMEHGDPEGIVFQSNSGPAVEFAFDDYDALCWATAIHRSFDLTAIRGLSLCFRMLALYQLMATNSWARALFTFDRRNNLKINKALLSAAAITPLLENGSFDDNQMRRETGADQLPSSQEPLRL